jgi:hypothetical protein
VLDAGVTAVVVAVLPAVVTFTVCDALLNVAEFEAL